MKAWAVLLGSNKWNRIYCVFADNEPEARNKAFDELEKAINLDDEDKGVLRDYRVVITHSAELPSAFSSKSNSGVPTGSSFEDQIKGIVKG